MSGFDFYTDRLNGQVPRTNEILPEHTASGLKALVNRRISSDWLAEEFPSHCPDGNGISGTNVYDLGPHLAGLVPGVARPLWQEPVTDATLFDIVEFVGQHVSKPKDGEWHSFMRHFELNFDRVAGRVEFRDEVNQLLGRGGTVFEMSPGMQIQRVGSPEVQETFRRLRPATGDKTLDDLIELARRLYFSRLAADRAIAIEKLWDGFERLKTLDDPSDKKRSVQLLLAHIADPAIRSVLETEMRALTDVGNSFQIRHHEVTKHPVPEGLQDYLASRMVALITHLLEQSGKLAAS